jgi:hypothetical protein
MEAPMILPTPATPTTSTSSSSRSGTDNGVESSPRQA